MKELEDLQMLVSFQEQTINELNTAVTDQQKQLDLLRTELRLLRDKLEELEYALESRPGSAANEANEKPPHY